MDNMKKIFTKNIIL